MPEVDRDDGGPRRVLLIASERPWPRDSGVRQRLGATLDGLARVAEVDLFSALPERVAPPAPPAGLPVARLTTVTGWADYRLGAVPRWLASGRPRSVALPRWADPARALGEWQRGPYDVAWFLGCQAFLGLPHPPARRYVLDVDDLPHQMLRHRLALAGSAAALDLRTRARVRADRLDERRWTRLFPALRRRADLLLVCSETDRERVGGEAVVLPNGYDAPAVLPPRRRRDATPVLAFVGGLDYPPNADAAQFAAREILPLVRAVRPGTELWLIGHAPPAGPAARLARLPGVRVRGRVPDISAELAEVDVAVAPIRFGGGTRIKILEAFAHRVPVVSTTVGCEGLAVRAGSSLLVADGAADFAAACLRLLGEPALRAALTAEGAAVQAQRYRWDVTRDAVAGLVARLAATPS
jgi:glycosyltransferase involved in cell wall biosynthesis